MESVVSSFFKPNDGRSFYNAVAFSGFGDRGMIRETLFEVRGYKTYIETGIDRAIEEKIDAEVQMERRHDIIGGYH